MDTRKVIEFGKNGYVITLPKDWVKSNDLSKKSYVSVEKKGESLIISPKKELTDEPKDTSSFGIVIDDKDMEVVKKEILSSYLNNQQNIIIKGKQLKNHLPQIMEHVKELVALEVIESEQDKIVLKDFLDFSDVDIKKILRKNDIIIRSMFSDLLLNDEDIHKNIVERSKEVNRHFYLIVKYIKKGTLDDTLLKKPDLKIDEAITIWSISLALENISDNIKSIIRQIGKGNESAFELLKEVKNYYTSVMKYYYKKEPHKAIKNKSDELKDLCHKEGSSLAHPIQNVVDNINLILKMVYF